MPPNLAIPKRRRGEAWSPWSDHVPAPLIDPIGLRPGIDVLRVARAGSDLPVGLLVVYVSHAGGTALVAVEGERGAALVEVPGHVLDEAGTIIDPCNWDYQDFREGFAQGVFEAVHQAPISEKVQGRAPSWYGRGVVAGYEARELGKSEWFEETRAFNRLLRSLPPDRWPKALPWEERVSA